MISTACILEMGQKSQNKNFWYSISYIIKQMFAFKYSWFKKKKTISDIKEAQQMKRPTQLVLIVFILASIMSGLASCVNEFNP